MTSYSNQEHKRGMLSLAFAAIYIAIGILLFYLNLTGAVSSTLFAIGIFVLIIVSLVFKFAVDFLRRRSRRTI